MSASPNAPLRPLDLRILERLPTSPYWTGPVLGILLLVGFALGELASDRPQRLLAGADPASLGCPHLVADYRIAVIGVLALAWLVEARELLAGLTRRTLEAARTLIADPTVFEVASRRLGLGWYRAGSALGVVGILACGIDVSDQPIEATATYWSFVHTFNWVWCVPFGWLLGGFLVGLADDCSRVARIGRTIQEVDLLDLGRLQPIYGHGARAALFLVVVVGLLSIHFTDSGTGWMVGGLVTVTTLAGFVAVMQPVLGMRRCIRHAKERALRPVCAEIQELAAVLEEPGMAGRVPSGRIRDLVSIERRIAKVSEWPYASSILVRVLLYAIVGLGSWMGAATVELVLDAALG